jgi:hypothetical protein
VPPTTVSPSKLAYQRDLNCRVLGSNRDHSKQAVCITVRARCKEELVVRTVVREGIMAKLQCPNIVRLRQNPKPLKCPSSIGANRASGCPQQTKLRWASHG